MSKEMKRMNLSQVKKGDKLQRLLGGKVAMDVIVGEIDDTHIWVGSIDGRVKATKEEGWKFNRETSLEVDEDLGWDGKTKTGSFLVENN